MKVPNSQDLRALEEEMIATGKGSLISGHEHWEDPSEFLTITIDTLRAYLGETVKILILNVPGKVTFKEFICTVEEDGGRGKSTLPHPRAPSTPAGYTIAV